MPDRVLHRVRNFFAWIRDVHDERMPQLMASRATKWAAFLLFSALVTLITTLSLEYVPQQPQLGNVASRDIKADRDYEIVDEEATGTFRTEAQQSVAALYTFDEGLVAAIVARVHAAFRETRVKAYQMAAANAPKDASKASGRPFVLTANDRKTLKDIFVQKIGITPTDEQWNALVTERMSSRVESIIIDLIAKTMNHPVVAERGTLDAEKARGIVIRRTLQQEGKKVTVGEQRVTDIGAIRSTEEARGEIAKADLPTPGLFSVQSKPLILGFAGALIEPNCIFERQETEQLRAEAAKNVKNVIIKIRAGEMIIRNGSRFEPWHIKVFKGIQKERGRGTFVYEFFGTVIVVLIFLVVTFSVAEHLIRRFRPTLGDYVLMAVVSLVTLIIVRISIAVAPAIEQVLYFSLPDRALVYALPIAAAVMMVRMLLSFEVALVFAIPMSIFLGLFAETGMRFAPFALIMNLGAILAVTRVDRRIMFLRAGAIAGVSGALMILGLKLLGMTLVTEVTSLGGLLWYALFGFLGGSTSALVAMIALPVIESVSGYVTDIKLLELANLNHPLLRELIVRAPGTYHHSHLVGILAEAAAEAIGANPLLARVGAYYHDVGKMKKPQYFIENMKGGENRHERLSPHMSALIVSSHVKEGMEMASRAGLPQSIVDMIPQHHGTRMIGFFYEKAKAQEDPEIQKIDEKEFCYPGPKPQTREAAILMLADVTEASVRSLKEKTSVRIQQTVEKCISDVFAESQLDECDLTLKDLNDIGHAFVRILLGIYHQRIEYPQGEKEDSLREASDVQPPSPQAPANPIRIESARKA